MATNKRYHQRGSGFLWIVLNTTLVSSFWVILEFEVVVNRQNEGIGL